MSLWRQSFLRNSSKVALGLFLCIFFVAQAAAQHPTFRTQELVRWQNNIKVNKLLHDRNGWLWIGTSQGLFRYDGYGFTRILEEGNEVTAIFQASDGTVWIGQKSGEIHFYKEGKLSPFSPEEGNPAVGIQDFAEDDKKRLWMATYGEGLYYYDTSLSRLYNLSSDDGLSDDFLYDLQLNGHSLWAGTDAGISIISLDGKELGFSVLDDKKGLPDNIVQSLESDGNGNSWIGMQSAGVALFSQKNNALEWSTESWGFGSVKDLSIVGNELWIATERKGLVVIDRDTRKIAHHFYKRNQLKNDYLLALETDAEGNVWLGSTKGLTQAVSQFIRFSSSGNNVLSLCKMGEQLWYTTEAGVFKHYTDEKGREVNENIFLEHPELEGNYFVSITADNQGLLWLGTYGKGLLCYRPATKKYRWITEENGLINGNVLHLQVEKNSLWLSTLGGVQEVGIAGLNLKNEIDGPLSFLNIDKSAGLGSLYTYSTFTDSKKRTWIASDGGGLSYWQNGKLSVFPLNEQLPAQTTYSVTEDPQGNIWFSVADAGIFRFANDSLQAFNTENGLRDNFVNSLVVDAQGNIVVFHRSGIDILDPKTENIIYLGQETGLGQVEPNLNSDYPNASGDIYFGTSNGIIIYNGKHSAIHESPQLLLENTFLFDEPITNLEGKTLNSNENNLSFEFTGVWFRAPKSVRYQYQLLNYDRDWISTQNRQVTYSQLPPGNYTFQLKASHSLNFEKSTPLSVSFTILPPFWQRWWFIALCLLAVGSAVWLFIRQREKNLRENQLELERLVEERTEELRHQRDEIEKKNQQITSSIQYASRIQQAILPSAEEIEKALPDTLIFFKPRDVVSGDFYWFLEKEGKEFIVAADCTGHGVPGSLMSMLGCELLEKIIAESNINRVDQILNELHVQIRKLLRQHESQNRDGMDIAICMIDRENKMVEYAGAKNPLLWFRNGETHFTKGDKMPIGGLQLEKERIFFSHQIPLEGTTQFFLYSDGYQDQFGGGENKKFLAKNFRNMLEEMHQLPVEEQLTNLEKRLYEWKGSINQTDDILVVGFRVTV